ncbi:hypothetical protein NM688_g8340 [Phlebia brevispora]|uniref:Uncharacterized protein n=1 Tax=Phlebia brevispora TaxID=194682 RepID=A0ACC1RUF9_9APHY|nr:hypothetical protein NM688_g8340 [Phlebia brevispora]
MTNAQFVFAGKPPAGTAIVLRSLLPDCRFQPIFITVESAIGPSPRDGHPLPPDFSCKDGRWIYRGRLTDRVLKNVGVAIKWVHGHERVERLRHEAHVYKELDLKDLTGVLVPESYGFFGGTDARSGTEVGCAVFELCTPMGRPTAQKLQDVYHSALKLHAEGFEHGNMLDSHNRHFLLGEDGSARIISLERSNTKHAGCKGDCLELIRLSTHFNAMLSQYGECLFSSALRFDTSAGPPVAASRRRRRRPALVQLIVCLCVLVVAVVPVVPVVPDVVYNLSSQSKPSIYRAVIDDVIANIKSEFDEYGVSEDVLAELQHVSPVNSVTLHSFYNADIVFAVEMGSEGHCIPCCRVRTGKPAADSSTAASPATPTHPSSPASSTTPNALPSAPYAPISHLSLCCSSTSSGSAD